MCRNLKCTYLAFGLGVFAFLIVALSNIYRTILYSVDKPVAGKHCACNDLLILIRTFYTFWETRKMSIGAKVTDLIKDDKFSFSFEVTPDVPHEDVNNMKVEPLFFSVTWHAKTHGCKDLDIAPVKIAKYLRSRQKQVLMHLACDMLRKDFLDQLLKVFQENQICNLFVILGESYDTSTSDFKSSKELITYIRNTTGDYFCIGVAGSPDHPDDKLIQLKEKIVSGADFILTQAFFDKEVLKVFVKNCKEIGITAPIIPGVFLFENSKQLKGFINLCKVKVSNDLLEKVEKGDLDKSGREIVKKLMQDVTTDTDLKHFHFFTMNKLDFVSEFVREY